MIPRHLHRALQHLISVLVCALIFTSSVQAKKNITDFNLTFSPQQTVGAAEADLDPDMWDHPVRLQFEDLRKTDHPEKIGTRSDDDDDIHELTVKNSILDFLDRAFTDQLDDWNIGVDEDADLVLYTGLTKFKIKEENQAVGALYNSDVRFKMELRRGGKTLWQGTVFGDATRYGKKFSNANCNEVLSDAVLEALAEALSHDDLQDVWESQ